MPLGMCRVPAESETRRRKGGEAQHLVDLELDFFSDANAHAFARRTRSRGVGGLASECARLGRNSTGTPPHGAAGQIMISTRVPPVASIAAASDRRGGDLGNERELTPRGILACSRKRDVRIGCELVDTTRLFT